MKSFHNDPALKAKVLQNLRRHQELDQFAQGFYWDKLAQKGCAIGCTIVDFGGDPSDHKQYEKLFGIPEGLARIEDRLFERMDFKTAKEWPIKFIEAVPVGVDLNKAIAPFLVFVLSDEKYGCRQFANNKGKAAIDKVVDLYKRRIAGEEPLRGEWKAAATTTAFAAAAFAAAFAATTTAAAAFAADACNHSHNFADADFAADAKRKELSKKHGEKLLDIIAGIDN